jgi:crossover junction endodeoxyribonuclease RusA
MIRIVVLGMPGPQGSKRFVGASKTGRGIMIESSAKVKPWRQDVKASAELVMDSRRPLDGPLVALVTFTIPKPSSAPKSRRTWPCRKPDLSKLVRSTEDALTDAGVWADDARVVELVARKCYPKEGPGALHVPGAVIEVFERHEVDVMVQCLLALAES